MSNLITNKFREHLGEQLIESITEPANNVYYLLASKHTPYSEGDNEIPIPNDSFIDTEQLVYQEGIFAKKITSSDISLMISKREWTANTVYDAYDQTDNELFDRQFYVYVDQGSTYYVYKCLDNNRGSKSIERPESISESACNFITTSDGYVWKLMYKLPDQEFEKFATDFYMPVRTSSNVSSASVSGAIDAIKIVDSGSSYVAKHSGRFQVDDLRELIPFFSGNTTTYRLSNTASSNSNFYVGSAIYIDSGSGAGQLRSITEYISSSRVIVVNTAFTTAPSDDSTYIIAPNIIITGDGTGAVGYATVSSNSTVNNFISKINIVSRGTNYTYADAIVTGNTAGESNNAILKAIIPPIGGHGKDAPSELGVKAVGISVSFNNSESGYIPVENDYRKLIVLKDPLIDNVTLSIENETGIFSTGETIYQVDYKTLTGTVSGNTTTTNIRGVGTQLSKSLSPGDKVIITDTLTELSCLRTIDSVTNSTFVALTDELPFTTSFATIAAASVLATGVKIGNSSPYLTMSNTEPKFTTGKVIIGGSSGAIADVTGINVNEKNYNNWTTLDNRTRISYTSSSGTIEEDSKVYQSLESVSNAYYHSSNNTYVFLTSEKGVINADPNDPLFQSNGSANFTLGSVKYTPDIVKGTGKVLYIENTDPISRSISQSETVKLIIKF